MSARRLEKGEDLGKAAANVLQKVLKKCKFYNLCVKNMILINRRSIFSLLIWILLKSGSAVVNVLTRVGEYSFTAMFVFGSLFSKGKENWKIKRLFEKKFYSKNPWENRCLKKNCIAKILEKTTIPTYIILLGWGSPLGWV